MPADLRAETLAQELAYADGAVWHVLNGTSRDRYELLASVAADWDEDTIDVDDPRIEHHLTEEYEQGRQVGKDDGYEEGVVEALKEISKVLRPHLDKLPDDVREQLRQARDELIAGARS